MYRHVKFKGVNTDVELLIRLQVYIVSFFVLLIIYVQIKEESQSYLLHDRLFKYLILATIWTLVIEAISWMSNGSIGEIGRIIKMSSHVLLVMTATLPLSIWTLYIIATTNKGKEIVTKVGVIQGSLILVNMLMALSAPFNEKYFYIDSNNRYHRGEWETIGIIIHVILFAINVAVIFSQWKKINPRDRLPILFFIVPPITGFVIQMMFYGTSLVWPGGTISILMAYIMIQTQVVKTDYLTGLYNRRQLDIYLEREIRNLPKNKRFGGIMIDMDDFKQINDQYGHVVGDQAIKKTASIIRKSCRKDDFIARYGGDEFAVILNVKDEVDLRQRAQKIKRNFELFNKRNEEPYQLKTSMGYSICGVGDERGDEFLNRLDQLMYDNKKERKGQIIQ